MYMCIRLCVCIYIQDKEQERTLTDTDDFGATYSKPLTHKWK